MEHRMMLTIWSDIACPWATLLVWRLHARRAALDVGGAVTFEHRAFPLELFNSRPTPRAIVDAEIEALAPLAPEAGWRAWPRDPAAYPVTTLLPLEAVQAAKAQGLDASERLDLALRQAFWRDGRCISLRHEVLAAAEAAEVDAAALADALDAGTARRSVIGDWRAAADGTAEGSPYVVPPSGEGVLNPGIEQHWEGPHPGGRPVVDRDDVTVLDDLLRAAAGVATAR
jgi:predicted DsbA family dithiol-disulfide isomerase